MCLIIAPGKDGKPALLPREVFDYAYDKNKDGFGAMWVEDGRVQHFKTLGLTADEIYSQMEERVERSPDVIFHMRLKTHGATIPGLSHPFRILNKKRHGKDLFFMHNGILGQYGNNLTYGQSDTTVFKDKLLIPLLTRDPDALDDPEVWDSIERLTQGSRLAFMDSDGKTYFTHPSSWNGRYGLQLSNTYMLPYKSQVKKTSSNNSPVIVNQEEMTVTGHFVYFRQIDKNGVVGGHWVSCPKLGFVRTEVGHLYKDNGPNVKIYHAVDFIPKAEEYKHLGLSIVPPTTEDIRDFGSAAMNDDFDDDLPWEADASSSVDRSEFSTLPAPEDQRLRYARLIHNMYAGVVASRPHLIADLIGMGDKELSSFVDEDPESSTVVIAELVEMVLEYNDALWHIDPNHEKILNPDEIIRIGQSDYHRLAIQEITKIRRLETEDQIRRLNGILDEEQQEEVHVA